MLPGEMPKDGEEEPSISLASDPHSGGPSPLIVSCSPLNAFHSRSASTPGRDADMMSDSLRISRASARANDGSAAWHIASMPRRPCDMAPAREGLCLLAGAVCWEQDIRSILLLITSIPPFTDVPGRARSESGKKTYPLEKRMSKIPAPCMEREIESGSRGKNDQTLVEHARIPSAACGVCIR